MNLEKVAQSLEITFEKIEPSNLGITNKNYILYDENGTKYFVRIPDIKRKDVFNREHELVVEKIASSLNLNIPYLYFNVDTGIKVTAYVEELSTFNNYHGADRIKKVALLMRKFHSSKIVPDFRFNPKEKLMKYFNAIDFKLHDFEQYFPLIDLIDTNSEDNVLCHNDWVEGNICFKDDKSFLIDYEYATANNPLFDVMSFITENDLTAQEEIDFINYYFENELNDETSNQLELWRNFHNLLWSIWGNMMYDQTKREIFKEISFDKFSKLKDL